LFTRRIRVRLLQFREEQKAALHYPTLTITVEDTKGRIWAAPTLAEAIAILRSPIGLRIRIESLDAEHVGDIGEQLYASHLRPAIVIEKSALGYSVTELSLDDIDVPSLETMHDFSINPPVHTGDGQAPKVVDLDVLSHFEERFPHPDPAD
jgi:hypothetical protein